MEYKQYEPESLNQTLGRILFDRRLSDMLLFSDQLKRGMRHLMAALYFVLILIGGAYSAAQVFNHVLICPIDTLQLSKTDKGVVLESYVDEETTLFINDGREVKSVTLYPSQRPKPHSLAEQIQELQK